jgi:triacylglycerol lipase
VGRPHHILLVPGFFGFANLGDFTYFGHVRNYIAEKGPELGIDGEVRVARTEPTASLARRAALLCEAVSTLLDESPGHVSLVGHSSGGLDARLMVTPGAVLPTPADVERCARSVRSVVTISTPHHGTPLAQFFGGMLGQQFLRLLSLVSIYTLRTGQLPISVGLRLARLLRNPRSRPVGAVDQIFLELLGDFEEERRRAVEQFLEGVRSDQGLVSQISPAGMDVFNASTQDRPGLHYGSVVTQARAPGIRSLWGAGLNPSHQVTHALFVALYRLSASTAEGWMPRVTREDAAVLRMTYGRVPNAAANDGIVPTLSQIHGELLAAAWADHHDVIGHYNHPTHIPPHFDWMASGTGFDLPGFDRVWRRVANFAAKI